VELGVDWNAYRDDVKGLFAEAIAVANTMEDEDPEERGSLAHEGTRMMEQCMMLIDQVSNSSNSSKSGGDGGHDDDGVVVVAVLKLVVLLG